MPGLFKQFSWITIPLGLCLLVLAASRGELVLAQGLTPTPTVDRLAKPTMPANPSQADFGAEDYWLNCSPCHGDQGQGLTEDFRQQYPVEDQNCWLSGCHGRRPYPNGWTIPDVVPALIGPGTLSRFGTGAVLKAYIQAKMPFQTPGSLDEDTYWRLAAFLLRENGYWSGAGLLDETSAVRVRIASAVTETPLPIPTLPPFPTSTPFPPPTQTVEESSGAALVRWVSALLLFFMGLILFLFVRRQKMP